MLGVLERKIYIFLVVEDDAFGVDVAAAQSRVAQRV